MLNSTLDGFFARPEFCGSHDAISPFDEVRDNCQFPVVSVLGVVSN